jgi:hypothetical protein
MASHGKVHPVTWQPSSSKEEAVPRILSGVQPTGNTHLETTSGRPRGLTP